MVVLSLQCIHEWNHHHTHHIEGVCHHHHAHSNVPSMMEAGASVAEECLICDWNWVPFESIPPMDSKILDQQWQQRFKIGLVKTGYSSNHNNQTKSHRGPPKRGWFEIYIFIYPSFPWTQIPLQSQLMRAWMDYGVGFWQPLFSFLFGRHQRVRHLRQSKSKDMCCAMNRRFHCKTFWWLPGHAVKPLRPIDLVSIRSFALLVSTPSLAQLPFLKLQRSPQGAVTTSTFG